MITLTTGLPGAGKTLRTIWMVEKLRNESGREVYYSGITDLNLPWILFDDPTKWHELPQGSIVVIDECQKIYRNRANGSAVPPHVAELETHRHKGFDIFLITQDPRIIDSNVRRLTERHFHLMRRFGGTSAVCHEFLGVKEGVDKSRSGSQSHTWHYPKEVYDYYKSAEIHTHKRRFPFKLLALPLMVVIVLFAGWFIYNMMKSKDIPNQQKSVSGSAMPSGFSSNPERSKKLTTKEWLADQEPRIQGLPHTAPAYDDLAKAQSVPAPQACVQMAKKCKCYTDQATPIEVTDDMCKNIVANGIYLPHLKTASNEQIQDEKL